MLDGTDGRTPDRCFTSIPEERNSTRTLGPDPTTFEVCRVQPISGPDQVVKMKSSVTEWESSRGRISQPSLKFVCDQRPAPDSLKHYLDSLTGFLGRWGEGGERKGKRKEYEDKGCEGNWDSTEFGGRSMLLASTAIDTAKVSSVTINK